MSVIISYMKSDFNRIHNLKFVLSRLKDFGLPIIIVEQAKPRTGSVKKELAEFDVEIVQITSLSKDIEKSKLINAGVDYSRSPYIWVHDADIVLRFEEVVRFVDSLDRVRAVKPYNMMLRLTEEETREFMKADQFSIAEDKSTVYPMVFGAASFIMNKNLFWEIGGMDERFCGWGYEDEDLEKRLKKREPFVTFDKPAVHLFHPMPTLNKNNLKVFEKVHGKIRKATIRTPQ